MQRVGDRPDAVHVSSVHSWTDNRIHYRECVSLANAGYKVALVAVQATTDAPTTNVEVNLLPRMRRPIRLVVGSMRAVGTALKTRARLFHLHDPELVWAVPFLRMLGKKVIYDAHEDLPNQVAGKAYIGPRLRPAAVAMSRLITRVARLSHHIVAATPTIAERFPAGRVSVVRNYPRLRDEELSPLPIEQRQDVAAYVGLIAETRGAEVMVGAAGDLRFPDGWRLTLAGPVPDRLLDRLTATGGWGRTDYKGVVSPPQARDLLLSAKVGLVLLEDKPAHRDALPTKMFEYFAAGLPVIASNFPLWADIIERHECGLLVEPTSPVSVAAAVRRYADDPSLLSRHSANARNLALNELNWSVEEKTLVSVYRRLLVDADG